MTDDEYESCLNILLELTIGRLPVQVNRKAMEVNEKFKTFQQQPNVQQEDRK